MKLPAKLAALLLLAVAAAPAADAQGRKSLRINEVMVVNDSSVVDEFGARTAWIELYNPTFAAVDIASAYLTDDPENPTKYYIPRGDARTKIAKRQTSLFFADGEPNHGTFHLNFRLEPGVDNFIALYDADGISLIDSVTIPASLAANCSWARTPDGAEDSWQARDDSSEAAAVTPGGLNDVKGPNHKIENFKKMDSNGTAMAMMAMTIVFGALLVLCLCFLLISKLSRRQKAAPAAAEPTLAPAPESPASADGEVAAAIALALHQHLNGGVDGARLTINHNPASAWTSKTQAMREYPRR